MLVTTTFSPLREVEQTAAAIADGDFSQRLGGATPNTEVGRLNRSLNTMLNRIDRAFTDRARTIEQMRRFVGDASHELRTPLVSVRGYAELYRMGALQTPEDVAQAMDRIEKEAIRMGILVEDLLELARLDETKPLDLHPVDLVQIARDAAMDAMAGAPDRVVTVLTPPSLAAPEPVEDDEPSTLDTMPLALADQPSRPVQQRTNNSTGPIAFAGATLARLRRGRGRRVSTDTLPISTSEQLTLAEPDPAPAEPAIVLAEENKLRQVVTNLMGNALRYTPAGSPIEIGVQVDHRTKRATIEVRDHGEGIPPQIREKIFQRFWRADTSRTRETGGSGLGLAIVASIVAAHHGTVEVVETDGGGATFRVTLPLADSAAAPQPAAQ
jgi:two-component system OmpR family sensor kinase